MVTRVACTVTLLGTPILPPPQEFPSSLWGTKGTRCPQGPPAAEPRGTEPSWPHSGGQELGTPLCPCGSGHLAWGAHGCPNVLVAEQALYLGALMLAIGPSHGSSLPSPSQGVPSPQGPCHQWCPHPSSHVREARAGHRAPALPIARVPTAATCALRCRAAESCPESPPLRVPAAGLVPVRVPVARH